MVDSTKSFEVENGVTLSESGAGLFSDAGVPSFSAPNGSRYYRTDTEQVYYYHSGHWHLHFDASKPARNSISLFISDVNGQPINTGAYSAITFQVINGTDQYVLPMYVFTASGESSSGGTMDIKLVRKSDGLVIGTLSWNNETVPTLKSIDVSANMPAGDEILQLEGRRSNGTGRLYSAGLEVTYG